ncbi:cytochrome P450 [Sphingobium phenoxybenzoativorans]|uniref:Cytochrome P450 n=1 Tax=Sphingobium phenoxybenzoativorans TaxID=1592790 RepID=A0A975K9A3_9SPHN|nr:cytochrome P450 [Sphingobium phenoxybenzoativorans]QUT06724.1 cytochrome P450 [Sphingobium phenoxybenzoativorans]
MTDTALAMEIPGDVPAHVPPDLVIPFDFYSDPKFKTDPFGAIRWQQTEAPRIFYSPTHYMMPGCWVITKVDDIRHVQQRADLFSSRGQLSFAALIGESWDLIPVELDPPEHGAYRAILNPLFSPKEVAKMEAGVLDAASSLLNNLDGKTGCEFIEGFAQPFPVSVFLQLLGLPVEEMPMFLSWEHGLLKSFSLDKRKESARNIVGYLRNAIKERRANRGTDLISYATHAEVDGRKMTDDEIIGICFLLFIAGLDTVASSLGFHFNHLATDQDLQAKLRADRSLIPNAIEEFLRLYSVIISHRRVAQDTEIGGVLMKAGDWVSVPTGNGSRDASEFADPDTFDLNRNANRHVAFSYGMHRCIGSHLARREFVVAMNAWFDRVPQFRKDMDAPYRTNGGAVFGVEELHLRWD